MKKILFPIIALICVSDIFAQTYPNDYAFFVPYNRMSHSSNGNIGVGFGFNNPQSLLHVNGDIQSNGIFRSSNGTDFMRLGTTDASSHSFIQFGDDAVDQLRFQYATVQSGNVTLNRNVMTLTSYGMVGIGTTSPSNALTIDTDIATGLQLNGTNANYNGITVNAANPSGNPRYSYSTQGFEVVRHEYDDDRNWNLSVRPFGSTFFKTAITVAESGKVFIPNLDLVSPLVVRGNNPDVVFTGDVTNTAGAPGGLYFTVRNGNTNTTAMAISPDGNVGIGMTSHLDVAGGFKLSVKGKMVSEQAWVLLQQDWPDYVFSDEYKLRSLDDVKRYIKTNGHLPEVPSAATIEEKGVNMGEMHATLMKKIEELTLYLIDVKDELESVKKEVTELREENKKLTASNSK